MPASIHHMFYRDSHEEIVSSHGRSARMACTIPHAYPRSGLLRHQLDSTRWCQNLTVRMITHRSRTARHHMICLTSTVQPAVSATLATCARLVTPMRPPAVDVRLCAMVAPSRNRLRYARRSWVIPLALVEPSRWKSFRSTPGTGEPRILAKTFLRATTPMPALEGLREHLATAVRVTKGHVGDFCIP